MNRYHQVSGPRFEGDEMILTIDGQERRFRLSEISSVLRNASEEERNTYETSPSGYGIHWPLLDEDLSIDGLLGIEHAPQKNIKSTGNRKAI